MRTRHLTPADLRGLRWRGWVRESTERQAKKLAPVKRQRDDILRAATELGMVGPDLWYQRTGSGEAEGMVELEQALADAGQYDVLVSFSTSRFARNRAEAVTMKRRFARSGVILYFVAERIISGAYASALSEGVHEVLDEHANEERRLWIAGGLRQRQLSGRWVGAIPYGYRKVMADREDGSRGWDGSLEPDPQEAPVVRRMFGRLAEGAHTRTIAGELTAAGVTAPGGGPWQRRTILDMSRNPTYAGLMVRYRERSAATYYDRDSELGYVEIGPLVPPIVERALWDQVQAVERAYASRPRVESYPLSTVMRCSGCGHKMTGATSRGVRYYRCSGRASYGVCDAPAVRADRVERAFGSWLGSYRLPDDWRDEIARTTVREVRTDERDRQAKLQGRLARLRDLYLWGDIDRDEYRRQEADIKGQMTVVPMPSMPTIEAIADALTDLGDAWAGASPDERSALPAAILSSAQMERDRVEFLVKPELRPLLDLCIVADPELKPDDLDYAVRFSA